MNGKVSISETDPASAQRPFPLRKYEVAPRENDRKLRRNILRQLVKKLSGKKLANQRCCS
jgi:hypothetical protein